MGLASTPWKRSARWRERASNALWWLLVAGLVALAAVYVGVALFASVVSAVAAGTLAIGGLAWLVARATRGDRAPLLTQATWTKGGVVIATVATITGAAAINSGLNLLYLLFGVLIGYLLVSGLMSSRAIRGLKLARHVPQRAFASQPFDVVVELSNLKRRWTSIAVGVYETLSGSGFSATRMAFAPVVSPGQSVSLRCTFTAARRGRYWVGPYRVSTWFPFGFFRKSLSWGERQELVVYPAIGTTKLHLQAGHGSQRWQRRQRPRRHLGIEEFRGLREYRPGDNPKWIHWRTTARFGKTMVRELESEDTQRMTLLLDTYAPANDAAAAQRLETAVSLAATLACEYAQRGYRLSLVTHSPNVRTVLPDAGWHQLDEVLLALALVEPAGEPVAADLIRDARGREVVADEALLISLGGGGAEAGPVQALGNGIAMIDVSHPGLGAVFELSQPGGAP